MNSSLNRARAARARPPRSQESIARQKATVAANRGKATHLDRAVLLDVCKDGTISYRRRDEARLNGVALPFFSVDTDEQAQALQVMLCSRQYGQHPRQPGRPWYRRWQFSGTIDDIPALTELFSEAYTRINKL